MAKAASGRTLPALGSPYPVAPGVSANAYIMMPENAGIAVSGP